MLNNAKALRILLVRDDKMGDVLLTYPAICALRASLAKAGRDVEIDMLVNSYTEPVTRLLGVRALVHERGYKHFWQTVVKLKAQRYDGAIVFFSTMKSALLLHFARVPYKVAPKTKLAQLLYRHGLKQRRSLCQQPEFATTVI